MAHGGERPAPRRPQPPSGPGRFANRGGATGQDGITPSQPTLVPSGGPYGSRQRLEQAQQIAPLPNLRGSTPGTPPPASEGAAPASSSSPFASLLGGGLGDPSASPLSSLENVLMGSPTAFPERSLAPSDPTALYQPIPGEEADMMLRIQAASRVADPTIRSLGAFYGLMSRVRKLKRIPAITEDDILGSLDELDPTSNPPITDVAEVIPDDQQDFPYPFLSDLPGDGEFAFGEGVPGDTFDVALPEGFVVTPDNLALTEPTPSSPPITGEPPTEPAAPSSSASSEGQVL